MFSRSLCLVMGGLFLLSWLAQPIAGLSAFNEEQLSQLTDPMTLAIGSMAVLSVYLRQRGSPELKPVSTPHGTAESSG